MAESAEVLRLRATIAGLEQRMKTLESVVRVSSDFTMISLPGGKDPRAPMAANEKTQPTLLLTRDFCEFVGFGAALFISSDGSIQFRGENMFMPMRDISIFASRDVDIKAGGKVNFKGSKVNEN